jgi:hypothetical protein
VGWLIGIDEAGYGPNLGPFVMTAVACRIPDDARDADLWQRLGSAVRRAGEADDGRPLVADSKVVYSTTRGLLGLERGVLGTLWPAPGDSLAALLERACPEDHAELRAEAWYRGSHALPAEVQAEEVTGLAARFTQACTAAGIDGWEVRSAVVCPPRFNALVDAAGSKGAVLGHGLARLLHASRAALAGPEGLAFVVDKHGGRNTYAAMIQDALPGGAVVVRQEGMACSAYEVLGLGREVRLTFRPRAEAECLCVALASMASKYLRELLMREFNGFWQQHVPGLKATAGYPGDAVRFLEAIRPAAGKLGIAEAALWRRK